MSSNNRPDPDDRPNNDMGMNPDRRDERADQGRRDDNADHVKPADGPDHGNRDSRTDHVNRADSADHRNRADSADHMNRTDSADSDTHDGRTDSMNRDDRAGDGRRDDRGDNQKTTGTRGNWLSPLLALLGIYMIALPLFLDVAGSHFWSAVLAGALLVGIGGYNFSRQADERVGNSALAMIAVATGLWLIAAPYVLGADTGLTGSAYELWFWSHIVVGLMAVGLGAYSAFGGRDTQQDTRQTKA